MTIDGGTLVAVGGVVAGVIGWCLHMALRIGAVERQCYASEAHQCIIITGMVRFGILRQEEVDAMRQGLRDDERKRGATA